MGVMLDTIGHPAMLEQFAEETSELMKAVLKKLRILQGDNPTPVTIDEANKMITEEYTDFVTCGNEFGFHVRWSNSYKRDDKLYSLYYALLEVLGELFGFLVIEAQGERDVYRGYDEFDMKLIYDDYCEARSICKELGFIFDEKIDKQKKERFKQRIKDRDVQ